MVLLYDQVIAQLTETVDLDDAPAGALAERKWASGLPADYQPYAAGEDGIPAMSRPGKGYRVHTTGLTHAENGFPTQNPEAVERNLERLFTKLERHRDAIDSWEEIGCEDAEVVAVAIGISARAALRAIDIARQVGVRLGLFRRSPCGRSRKQLRAAKNARAVLVPEMNAGQLIMEVGRILGTERVHGIQRYDGEAISRRRSRRARKRCLRGRRNEQHLRGLGGRIRCARLSAQGNDAAFPLPGLRPRHRAARAAVGDPRIGIDRDQLAVVSGIGCAGRLSAYIDANTFHVTHGRPLAYATGLALARPDLQVVVITGDGDCLAIGGNHLIHACRRNLKLTCLMLNNEVYGMTGGQVSPTTSETRLTTTTPLGNSEPHFRRLRARGCGRCGLRRPRRHAQRAQAERTDARRPRPPGFAFVEVLSDCTEIYGRKNELGSSPEMIMRQKSDLRPSAYRDTVDTPFRANDLPTGILSTKDRPEYGAAYRKAAAAQRRHGEKNRRRREPRKSLMRDARLEIRIGGTGGQGLILSAKMLADALCAGGRRVAQSQTYEPTSRGGYCNSDLVVSNGEVDFPLVTAIDALVLLDRMAVKPSWPLLKRGALVIADTRLCPELPQGDCRAHPLPLTRTAIELGSERIANIVALGAGGALRGVHTQGPRSRGARRNAEELLISTWTRSPQAMSSPHALQSTYLAQRSHLTIEGEGDQACSAVVVRDQAIEQAAAGVRFQRSIRSRPVQRGDQTTIEHAQERGTRFRLGNTVMMLQGDIGLTDDQVRSEDLGAIALYQRSQFAYALLKAVLRIAGNQAHQNGGVNPEARAHGACCGRFRDRTFPFPCAACRAAARGASGLCGARAERNRQDLPAARSGRRV